MFERFTPAARAVVVAARARACDEDAAEVRPDHLLGALNALRLVRASRSRR